MRVGYSERQTPQVKILNDGQIEMVRQAAFRILEETGAKVMHEKARKMLQAAGARVKDDIVKLPRYIVQGALATCPKGFTIYNREGKPCMNMSTGWVYYGTSTASPNTQDAETDEIHHTTPRDIELGAKIADALPNIDFVMPFGSIVDVPGLTPDIYEFDAVVRNTTKPMVCCGYSGRGTELVYEMAASVAGSMDDLVERPFVIMYPEPITPLVYSEMVVDRIFACADLRQPQIPCGSAGRGTTGPMTMAGTLALTIAESLVSITLAQLRSPGTPMLMAGNIGNANLASATTAIIPPERTLGYMAQSQVAASFGLPTWGLAASSESKLLDAQAGSEATFSLFGETLAGSTLIHAAGFLDSAMICSADMLVLSDEIIGIVRRIMSGIQVNEYELALDVINQVGPGGNFARLKHTAQNCRRDYWAPTGVFYREPYGAWVKAGSKDTKQRTREKTLKIIAEHKPMALADHKLANLNEIKERAIKELSALRQY